MSFVIAVNYYRNAIVGGGMQVLKLEVSRCILCKTRAIFLRTSARRLL